MIPILYVGAPGIGKTAYVKSQYDHCEILLLSSCCEEDISGLPYRDQNLEKRTLPKFVENINKIDKSKTVCLFLDEIDKSRREVADTLLTLITHPRHFGLDREIDIIAAANPPEWGGGDGVSKAMQSRFSIVDFDFKFENWAKWIKNKFNHSGVDKYIEMVEQKKAPILESNGEGFNFRLTCPRTIDLAFEAMISGKSHLIYGLLTTDAAMAMELSFSQYSDTLKPESIARTIRSKAKQFNLLRVK